jgi:hypothetical protein
VNSGGTILLPPDFTIVNDTTITYTAPTATSLGTTLVSVTNPGGTSNFGSFTYVETNPPKLTCGLFTGSGQDFTWEFGGAVNDNWWLLISTDPTKFNYKGFMILLNFTVLTQGVLHGAGVDSFQVVIPSGLGGLNFYSQVATFGPTWGFTGASSVKTTMILN